MSLKEITSDLHAIAEQTEFAKLLLSGTISKDSYSNYLYQMALVYRTIEAGCKVQGFLDKLPDIERAGKIYSDYVELVGTGEPVVYLNSTVAYNQYLVALLSDSDRQHLIKAHMYCRHMGDLFGGQMIKKKVPGSGRFYEFENAKLLKEQIRAELTDDLGDEARVAFEWAIKIMQELCNE